MSEKPENPPAFPIHGGPMSDPRNRILEGGLTMRDWFAGQALSGLLAGQYNFHSKYNLSEVPEEAFKIADAMLRERGKDQP